MCKRYKAYHLTYIVSCVITQTPYVAMNAKDNGTKVLEDTTHRLLWTISSP